MRDLPADLLALIVDGAWVGVDATATAIGASRTRLSFAGSDRVVDVFDCDLDVAPLVAAALDLEGSEASVRRSNVGGYHSHTDAFAANGRAFRARSAVDAAVAAARGSPPASPPLRKRARYAVAEVAGARLVVGGGADGDWRLEVSEDDAGQVSLAAVSRERDADAAAPAGDGVEAWFNVSRAGHFHALHDHAGARASGVLWLSTPPPPPPPLEHSGALFLALRGPAGDGDPGRYALLEPAPNRLAVFDGDLPHAVLPLAPDALRSPDDARVSLSFNYP